ncbi:hypothetical protein ABZ543_08310 [Streptomyces roseifaciens]
MSHSTDLNREAAPDGPVALSPETATILDTVATHFIDARPADILEPSDVPVAIGAAAYNLSGRTSGGGASEFATAALAAAPAPVGFQLTRGEYALRLRRALEESVEVWAEDVGESVTPAAPDIPAVPAPRRTPVPDEPPGRVPVRVPEQPQRQEAGELSCCGSPMRPDGRKLVCGRCGAWFESLGDA